MAPGPGEDGGPVASGMKHWGLGVGKSLGKELQKLVGTGMGWDHTGQIQP